MPITIKDNLAIAGLPTRHGSLTTPTTPAATDDPVVARIRAAGAVIIGKTTLPEFAHKVLTDGLLHGITRNPWSLAHTPGGSSGGASAAVAAGVTALAVGTDGGGSVRCPASCTGLVGLKATLGRVPNERAPDGFGNFSYTGPLARTAADAALLLRVIAGPIDPDPYSLAQRPLGAHPPEPQARGIRIGWIEQFGRYRTDPEVASLTAAAIGRLEAAGAEVEALHDPCFADLFDTYTVLASTAHAARFGPLAERFGDAMTESLRESIARGNGWSAVEWQRAHDRRTTLFRAVQRLFQRFDVLATPTMLGPPPLVDAGGSIATAMYAEWAGAALPVQPHGAPCVIGPDGVHRGGAAGGAAAGRAVVWGGHAPGAGGLPRGRAGADLD